jgi:hypothetical protein
VSGAAVLLFSHIQDQGIEILGLPAVAQLVAWAITNSTSPLTAASSALVRGGLLNVSAAIMSVDANLTAVRKSKARRAKIGSGFPGFSVATTMNTWLGTETAKPEGQLTQSRTPLPP